jgi:uncharacterized protein (DUF3084 family)
MNKQQNLEAATQENSAGEGEKQTHTSEAERCRAEQVCAQLSRRTRASATSASSALASEPDEVRAEEPDDTEEEE